MRLPCEYARPDSNGRTCLEVGPEASKAQVYLSNFPLKASTSLGSERFQRLHDYTATGVFLSFCRKTITVPQELSMTLILGTSLDQRSG